MLQPLPLNGPVYQNIDSSALPGQYAAELRDCYLDEMGNTVKRPGLAEWEDLALSSAVDGLYWWDEKGIVIAVCGGRVWKITDRNGTKQEITGEQMAVGRRPSFATDGTYLFAANGGQIIYTDGNINTARVPDVDAPGEVDFVDWVDLYLLMQKKGTDQLYYSEVAAPLNVNPLNFDVSYSQPDVTVAMGVANGEILTLGRRSIETWVNDGIGPFARLSSASVSVGSRSPYSLCLIRGVWYFLDYERRLVRLTGRVPEILSTPVEKVFATFGEVTDCLADFIFIAGQPLLVLSFPVEGKTWVYNTATGQWQGEWSYHNPVTNESERWLGNCYCYARDWNLHLVGDRRTGKIYTLDAQTHTDDSNTIRSSRMTGWVDHGTSNGKRSNYVRLRLKRGSVFPGKTVLRPSPVLDSESDPVYDGSGLPVYDTEGEVVTLGQEMALRWRDDGSQVWKGERVLSLGKTGENEFYTIVRNLGVYRSRQYELVMSDNGPWVLVSAEEDITVLTR